MRVCKKCRVEKEDGDFLNYIRKSNHDRIQFKPNCKDCELKHRQILNNLKYHKKKAIGIDIGYHLCHKCKSIKQDNQFYYSNYYNRLCYNCIECSKKLANEHHQKRLLGLVKKKDLRLEKIATEAHLICIACNKEKSFLDFRFSKDSKKYRSQCKECELNKGREYEEQLRFKEHMIDGTKPYKCELCLTGYKTKIGLSIHIKRKHSNISLKEYYIRYINPSIDVLCPVCGKERLFWSLALGFYSTCCKEDCIKKVPSLKRKNNNYTHSLETRKIIGDSHRGAKSVQWLGGKSDETSGERYDYGFTEQLRIAIRKRDNNICQICGRTVEQEGKELSCHHIDYNKKNNNPSNLISVCCKCHAKTTYGKRTYWTQYLSKAIIDKFLNKEVL